MGSSLCVSDFGTVQLSSGSDLGMLLVQHLKDKKTPVRDELLG